MRDHTLVSQREDLPWDSARPALAEVGSGVRRADRRSEAKRWLVWSVLVVLAAAAVAGGYLYRQSVGSSHPFHTAPVTRGPLTAAVSATGTLNAVIMVQVGSQVSGQIKELFADFNSQVKKAQVIARIDPDIFEAKVNQAKAQLEAAHAAVLNQRAMIERTRADLENARAAVVAARAQTAKAQVAVADSRRDLGRKRDLREKGFIAQADEDTAQAIHDSAVAQLEANRAQEQAQSSAVRAAEAQLKVAEAQLQAAIAQVGQNEGAVRQAQLDLDHSVIRAPVNGTVVSRNVDVGQTVAASLSASTLFTIAQDLSKMQVDTNVDEADVSRIRVGQRGTFTVDSFPGRTFNGEVVQIRKAAQVLQNVVTYDVVMSAANPELKLLPGMTANVKVVTDQKADVLRIPNAALRFRPPGSESERGPRSAPAVQPVGGPGAPGSARGAGLQGRAWVLGEDGKPQPLSLKLGISDGTLTEVLSDTLKDQREVIVGLGGPGDRGARPAGGPRLRL